MQMPSIPDPAGAAAALKTIAEHAIVAWRKVHLPPRRQLIKLCIRNENFSPFSSSNAAYYYVVLVFRTAALVLVRRTVAVF